MSRSTNKAGFVGYEHLPYSKTESIWSWAIVAYLVAGVLTLLVVKFWAPFLDFYVAIYLVLAGLAVLVVTGAYYVRRSEVREKEEWLRNLICYDTADLFDQFGGIPFARLEKHRKEEAPTIYYVCTDDDEYYPLYLRVSMNAYEMLRDLKRAGFMRIPRSEDEHKLFRDLAG